MTLTDTLAIPTLAHSRATYVNYRYHMPAMYLAMNNPEAASRYIARWAEQGYTLNSTSTRSLRIIS
jgi:hypothetical protein